MESANSSGLSGGRGRASGNLSPPQVPQGGQFGCALGDRLRLGQSAESLAIQPSVEGWGALSADREGLGPQENRRPHDLLEPVLAEVTTEERSA